MGLIPFLFWGLVGVAALVSFRWGAMMGLIVFVFALMLGAVAVSRWSPPIAGKSAGPVVFEAEAGRRPPIFEKMSVFSTH